MGTTFIGVLMTACSHVSHTRETPITETSTSKTSHVKASANEQFHYMPMDKFDHDLAKFIGLEPGESFNQAEDKIHAVFKAYDGHKTPLDISMGISTVEANWKQVLVTQDGLMDGTVTAQQLLAVFDEEDTLVSYGLRIKCYSKTGTSSWQTVLCE